MRDEVGPAYAMLAAFVVVVALIIAGVSYNYSISEPLPNCQEDEYMAHRPFPDGDVVCIHIDSIREN